MSTNVSSVTKHFPSAQNGFTTTTSGSVSSGATTVGLNSVAGYTNGETAVFVIDPTDATKKQTFTGVIDTAGVQVTGVVWTAGTNQSHALGATVVDYETATHWNMVTKGILVDHEQTGSHDTLTDSNGNEWLERGVTASAVNHLKSTNAATGNPPVLSATGSDTNIDLKLDPKGSGQVYIDGRYDGWALNALPAVSSVTANGNRSYDITFASTVASILSPGMRLRTTRTSAAPTQCTDLESGSSQYFSATSASLAGMTFTDDFTCSAWIKLESYTGAIQGIISRFDGTSGFRFGLNSTGQLEIAGFNAGAGNYKQGLTYQSIPLNKWVHVAANLNMSASTALMYIDGVLVPSANNTGGTNPTALVQAGNLNIGAVTAATFFDGKIAQAAVFSSVLDAATIRSYMSQGLSGSETNLVSAYSLNNSLLDLNTTNNNDLTANGGAAATNADSPFGNNATSSTLDYALVMAVSGSTATLQVPEGCTIPTSGGVTSVDYSVQGNPFGWVSDKGRWVQDWIVEVGVSQASPANNTWYNTAPGVINIPVGAWNIKWSSLVIVTHAGVTYLKVYGGLSTTASANPGVGNTAAGGNLSVSSAQIEQYLSREYNVNLSAATNYYQNIATTNSGASAGLTLNYAYARIWVTPTGL